MFGMIFLNQGCRDSTEDKKIPNSKWNILTFWKILYWWLLLFANQMKILTYHTKNLRFKHPHSVIKYFRGTFLFPTPYAVLEPDMCVYAIYPCIEKMCINQGKRDRTIVQNNMEVRKNMSKISATITVNTRYWIFLDKLVNVILKL